MRERALEEEKRNMREVSLPAEICGQCHGAHFFQLEGPHLPVTGAFEGEGEYRVLLWCNDGKNIDILCIDIFP